MLNFLVFRQLSSTEGILFPRKGGAAFSKFCMKILLFGFSEAYPRNTHVKSQLPLLLTLKRYCSLETFRCYFNDFEPLIEEREKSNRLLVKLSKKFT